LPTMLPSRVVDRLIRNYVATTPKTNYANVYR